MREEAKRRYKVLFIQLILLICTGIVNLYIAWRGKSACPGLHYAAATMCFAFVLSECIKCP